MSGIAASNHFYYHHRSLALHSLHLICLYIYVVRVIIAVCFYRRFFMSSVLSYLFFKDIHTGWGIIVLSFFFHFKHCNKL
ncbi:hypothetical protein V1514DRAFT_327482 [Lipomyces japonicus]|uniref:uncharacterized protein n=1 Tax=Lipomyces japonicus TaxID=56871 RepID=UPI0034CDD702